MRSLSRTWEQCLKMWEWIVAERRKHPGKGVYDLKDQWIARYYRVWCRPLNNCLFCEYSINHGDSDPYDCPNCPGALVSSQFHCGNSAYNFLNKPEAFLRKLRQLNHKRQEMKHG